ncbi:radical SAM protein [Roseibium sp. M-1]
MRLLLADGCNLRCSYCHFHADLARQVSEDGGTRTASRVMSTATVERSLREFASEARRRGLARFDLSLYGGEPLVNPKALQVAFAVVEELRNDGFQITPIVNTNATLMTDAWAESFSQAGARAHISLDGFDAETNAERVLPNGKGSFAAVCRGLDALKTANVPIQFNVVVTETNCDALEQVVELARSYGVEQIFLAQPDDTDGCLVLPPERSLSALLQARTVAWRHGIRAIGPWAVGTRNGTSVAGLPLNVIVRVNGQAFLPHFPASPAPGVAELARPETIARLEVEWASVLQSCEGCPIEEGCQGYMKMMTRYHSGEAAVADAECALARSAAMQLSESEQTMLQTSLLLSVSQGDGEDYLLTHPWLTGEPIEVSEGTVDLLDHFLPGSTPDFATSLFAGEELRETLDTLLHYGLLRPANENDDQRFLESLVLPHGDVTAFAGLLAGVTGPSELDLLSALQPHLMAAVDRLPARFKPLVDRCRIAILPGRARLAEVTGLSPDADELDWIAGTVIGSVVVLNGEACRAILAQGGRARLQAFEQQLAHELMHLMLRRRGLRLPVWLEEGFCELLSGATLDEARLAETLAHAGQFREFVLACMEPSGASGWTPETALVRFSTEPVDDNPGYALAHDFVRYLSEAVGTDELLDALSDRGLRARLQPFPLSPGDAGILGEDLPSILARWARDLKSRFPAPVAFSQPIRIVPSGDHFLIYNRIVGGYVWLDGANEALVAPLANRNLDVADVAPFLQTHPLRDELLARWNAGHLSKPKGFHLRLTVEGGCNMSCSYCYEGEKKRQAMTVETADQAIAAWRDLLEPRDLPGSSIRLFGGEPFMNWPLMKHVFDTAAKGLPEGSILWMVNTNGTLLRPEHVEVLSRFGRNMLIHLSLDGVGTANDRERVFNNGRGTFAHVDRAARMLLAAKVPLNFSVVLTPASADGLEDLVTYAAGLRDAHPGAPISVSIKSVIGTGVPHEDALKMAAALPRAFDLGEELDLDVGGEAMRAAHLLFGDWNPTGHFCGIGGRELYVTPEGRLMACHALQGSDYADLSAVAAEHRIPVPEHIATRHAGNVDGCSGCEVEGLCGGGCMAQGQMTTGSLSSKSADYFCMMMKQSFRREVARGPARFSQG